MISSFKNRRVVENAARCVKKEGCIKDSVLVTPSFLSSFVTSNVNRFKGTPENTRRRIVGCFASTNVRSVRFGRHRAHVNDCMTLESGQSGYKGTVAIGSVIRKVVRRGHMQHISKGDFTYLVWERSREVRASIRGMSL